VIDCDYFVTTNIRKIMDMYPATTGESPIRLIPISVEIGLDDNIILYYYSLLLSFFMISASTTRLLAIITTMFKNININ